MLVHRYKMNICCILVIICFELSTEHAIPDLTQIQDNNLDILEDCENNYGSCTHNINKKVVSLNGTVLEPTNCRFNDTNSHVLEQDLKNASLYENLRNKENDVNERSFVFIDTKFPKPHFHRNMYPPNYQEFATRKEFQHRFMDESSNKKILKVYIDPYYTGYAHPYKDPYHHASVSNTINDEEKKVKAANTLAKYQFKDAERKNEFFRSNVMSPSFAQDNPKYYVVIPQVFDSKTLWKQNNQQMNTPKVIANYQSYDLPQQKFQQNNEHSKIVLNKFKPALTFPLRPLTEQELANVAYLIKFPDIANADTNRDRSIFTNSKTATPNDELNTTTTVKSFWSNFSKDEDRFFYSDIIDDKHKHTIHKYQPVKVNPQDNTKNDHVHHLLTTFGAQRSIKNLQLTQENPLLKYLNTDVIHEINKSNRDNNVEVNTYVQHPESGHPMSNKRYNEDANLGIIGEKYTKPSFKNKLQDPRSGGNVRKAVKNMYLLRKKKRKNVTSDDFTGIHGTDTHNYITKYKNSENESTLENDNEMHLHKFINVYLPARPADQNDVFENNDNLFQSKKNVEGRFLISDTDQNDISSKSPIKIDNEEVENQQNNDTVLQELSKKLDELNTVDSNKCCTKSNFEDTNNQRQTTRSNEDNLEFGCVYPQCMEKAILNSDLNNPTCACEYAIKNNMSKDSEYEVDANI